MIRMLHSSVSHGLPALLGVPAVLSIAAGLGVALRSALAPVLVASRWIGGDGGDRDEIPDAHFSASLLGKKMLDDLLFTAELMSAHLISSAERERAAIEVDEANALFAMRGWLDEPRAYHPAPPSLSAPDIHSAHWYGLRFLHLRFESGYTPHPDEPGRDRWHGYTANRTAHAWVLQHPSGPRPWIVCVHGYRMGIPAFDFTIFRALWLHHQLGLNVVMPVLPLHGPRAKGWRSGDGYLSGDFIDTLHMQAQAAWDLRRVLSWVRAQGGERPAVYGISLGGYNAALLATLDGDLGCVIAGVPATDFVGMARRHMPGVVLSATEYMGLAWDKIATLLRVVSPLAMPSRVPTNRLFLFAGKADRLIPAPMVRDLWRHWGRPRIHWFDGGHASFAWDSGVHDFILEALRDSGFLGSEHTKTPAEPEALSA